MAYAVPSDAPGRGLHLGPTTVKVWVAGGVIALAVAYLIILGIQSSAEYFLTVSELQARGASAENQMVRVSGTLVPGTLTRDAGGPAVHFQIADQGSAPLLVVYRGGQVPDIVGDNIGIVAEGKLNSQGQFVARSVLAKCPSHLENAPPVEHQYGPSTAAT